MAFPKNKKLSNKPRATFKAGKQRQQQHKQDDNRGRNRDRNRDRDRSKIVGQKDNKGPKHGNKHGNKNKNRRKETFGGYGDYEGVVKDEVNELVDGLVNEEVRDLRNQMKEVNRTGQQAMADVNTDYQRGLGDLSHVYGESSDYINYLTGQMNDDYATQNEAITAANAALQQQLQGTYTGALDGANSELARLGIQGGGNLGSIAADGQFASNMAGVSGQNALDTLGLMNTNSQGMMGMLGGMNQGSYMGALGNALNDRNDQSMLVQRDIFNNRNEVREAIEAVRAGRSDMFLQLMNQLQQTGWGQYMDQSQLEMAQQQQQWNNPNKGKKKKKGGKKKGK